MDKNFSWILEIVTIITVFVIGLVGNIFVLIIVHKKNTRTKVHGIFVTCLAVADLVLLCFDSPISILKRFNLASEIFYCKVHLIVVTTSYNAGLFSRARSTLNLPCISPQNSVTCNGEYRRPVIKAQRSFHDVEVDGECVEYLNKWCNLFYVQTYRPTHRSR